MRCPAAHYIHCPAPCRIPAIAHVSPEAGPPCTNSPSASRSARSSRCRSGTDDPRPCAPRPSADRRPADSTAPPRRGFSRSRTVSGSGCADCPQRRGDGPAAGRSQPVRGRRRFRQPAPITVAVVRGGGLRGRVGGREQHRAPYIRPPYARNPPAEYCAPIRSRPPTGFPPTPAVARRAGVVLPTPTSPVGTTPTIPVPVSVSRIATDSATRSTIGRLPAVNSL